MDKYEAWTLQELRERLKIRGARVSGRKKESIARLESYDRNEDFGHEKIEREYVMDVPESVNFKDINSDTKMIEIKKESVDFYLEQVDRRLDNNINYLYNNRFLKFIRLGSCENSSFYIKSECRAQMKKNVSYKIDVKVNANGTIEECQCECAVGMGPKAHCKHVCTTLLAVHKFSTKKLILTEETCTQKIQSFHKSKPFHGSPKKADNLTLANNTRVNFDPRPTQYKSMAGYTDHFRSIWLNHPQVHEFPISQMYEPANTYAINHDHHYLNKPLADIWLDNMNITAISLEKVNEIQAMTIGQSDNKHWCEDRRKRLHSSNFGRICKFTERADQPKFADSLTKPCQTLKIAPILHGKHYECIALKQFEEELGVTTVPCGTFVSVTHPFLAASPDALLNTDTVIEVKCPYKAKNQVVSPETVSYIHMNGDHLTLDTNHDYFYQIQGQLFCTGRKQCLLVIYTFKGIKILSVARDDSFIAKMVENLKQFFNNHFRQAVLKEFYYRDYYRYNFK